MNKIYKALLFSFILCINYANAQDETQKKIITSQYKRTAEIELFKTFIKAKQKAIRDSALAKAKVNDWKIEYTDKSGSVSKLFGISTQGNPLYYKFQNLGAATTSRVTNLRAGGTLGLNLTGNNIQFAEWDNGSPRLTHSMLQGRVEFIDTTPIENHATHIAGTMIGSDALGVNSQGIAYGGTLRAYDSYDDLYEALVEATEQGRLLSNHSYGSDFLTLFEDEFGKYNEYSYWVDLIQEYAPYYLSVWASGNDRYDVSPYVNPSKNGYDLLSYWNVAKNGVVVGAVHQVNNYVDANSVQMSYFSNYGPTDDGRIKPDITTKGVDVLSCVETSDTALLSQSGTSTAAPVVTATLGLLQEHYFNTNGNYMKAATAKGLILHTADEAGTNLGPDYRFGWGLLNAEKAASTITNNQTFSLIQELELFQGETITYQVKAQGGSIPLIASVSWTDPAGNPVTNFDVDDTTPALVNDLDVRITKNATTYLPWKLGGMVNRTNAAVNADNTVDPFEKIEVNNAISNDVYTVTINHKGTLAYGSQNVSLIVTGITVECLSPSNVVVSAISETGAMVSWTAPTVAPQNGFEYEIRTTGSAGSGTTGLTTTGTVSNTTNQITLTNLVPGTNYSVYIRSLCDINQVSTWTLVKHFETCEYINGTAIFVQEVDDWSYYALSTAPDKYLFAIEKFPTGTNANTNAFDATITITDNHCFTTPNYYIKSSGTEAILSTQAFYNIDVTSAIKPNGFVNIRWFLDYEHLNQLVDGATIFQGTSGATNVSDIMYLKKLNSRLVLPENLRTDGLGLHYAVESLSLSSTGTLFNRTYLQFNEVTSIDNTGGGAFIRATSLPTSSSSYNTPTPDMTKKGSIRFNSLTKTFEGHNGIDWQPMH
ncbi:S8 family serine peptidase [Flavobacterium sp.]|uniref:S8 family serine peptidase n=1 Tax=Flavobacterium sp. TaxID=239 RepID=UPI000EBA8211|nr:S8 family serine peptidase [Flavobacterium sp.]HCQ13876.1 hypothetical protein [Flavobacterium sp.]